MLEEVTYQSKKCLIFLWPSRPIAKAWVAEHKEQIELFYLPSYSPQFNLEERFNADLKPEMSKRVPVRTKAKLCQAATEHMTMLVQTPDRIIGYFQDRHVKYAT